MTLLDTRWTVRRMMATVAIMAVLLAAHTSLRRELAPTPEEWALDQAAMTEHRIEQWRRRVVAAPSVQAEEYLRLAEAPKDVARYRTLARRYAETEAGWDEETWHGPYTCKLAWGQPALVRWAITARSATDGASVPLATGTPGIVVNDPASDDDAGECFREIEIRILEGPHAGTTVSVERESLRRR